MKVIIQYISIIWLCFYCICEQVESQNNPFDSKAKISFHKEKSFKFQIQDRPIQSEAYRNIILELKLLQGFQIHMVVMYGSQSESWTIHRHDNVTKFHLCYDANDHFQDIHIFLRSYDMIKDTNIIEYDSSDENIVELNAKWEDVALKLGDAIESLTVTSRSPLTLMVYHAYRKDHDRHDRFVLNVDSVDGDTESVCMMVAVYNQECPLHTSLTNIKSSEMWTTAMKSATMTIRADKFCFSNNFYVSVLVLTNDDDCEVKSDAGESCQSNESSLISQAMARSKKVRISIDKVLPYRRYVVPIVVALFLLSILVAISVTIISCKSYGHPTEEIIQVANEANEKQAEELLEEQVRLEEFKPETTETNGDTTCVAMIHPQQPPDESEDTVDGKGYDFHDGKHEVAKELCDSCQDAVIFRNSTRRKRINKGLNRLKDRPTLADNTKILQDVWFRRNRSKVYLYLVPLVSLYYFIPAIQFAFQAKENEEISGSIDLCYHNFKCQRPWWIFSDFNHVISNMAYWLLGLSFMIIVFIKSKKLPESNNPKYDHQSGTGILQQLSIFYTMGFSLFAQGCFSVVYHVCPTNLSLQYDTTMMYVICILCYVKLYQFRHPDATANAFSTMGLLGMLIK